MSAAHGDKPTPSEDDARNFLRLLYGEAPPGYLAIWTKQDKTTAWIEAKDINAAALKAAQLAKEFDCFFGIGLQPKRLGKTKRGTAATVSAIPGLWFDLDIKGPAHTQKDLPESLDAVLAFVQDLPLPPTAIVDSGNGVHLWWVFRDLWVFADDEDRERAAQLAAGWQNFLLNRTRQHDWKADNTGDLARLLRLPGTLNHKGIEKGFADQPAATRLVSIEADHRYDAADFTPHIGKLASDGPDGSYSNAEYANEWSAQLDRIAEGCSWLRHCRDGAETLPEPEWFAMVSIVGRCEDGRKRAHEWSRAYPGYDFDETDKKIDAALTKAGPRTCRSIREKAGGEDYCARCPSWSRIKSPISLGVDYLPELLNRYVYVVGMKQFLDLSKYKFLDKEQLSDSWVHRHSGPGNPARLALKSNNLVKVDNVTFAPGKPLYVDEEGECRVNLWRSADLEANADGDIEPFLTHIEYLIPEEAARNHILDFLAFTVQHPGEKINHALLIQGEEGTGKSFLSAAMERIHGAKNVVTVDTAELHSDFTSWIKQAQLVIVEEMMAFGRRDLMNKLKPMITQSHLRINEKYVPQFDIPNRANFLLFSNHKEAILLDEGDRRYFVYYSPVEPKEQDYYVKLFGWLEEYAGVLLHWLQYRRLTSFNPKARPPMTASKRQVIEASRPPVEAYLLDKFEAEEWPFTGDLVVPSHLVDVLTPRFKVPVIRVVGILQKLGGVRLGQKRMGDGTKPTVYAMRKPKIWEQADENTIADKYTRPVKLQGEERKKSMDGKY